MRICSSTDQYGSDPGNLPPDHTGYTGPTRRHELDHADHTDCTHQEDICHELSTVDQKAGKR